MQNKKDVVVALMLVLVLGVWLVACNAPKAAENKSAAPPPAKIENAVKESDLATIKLTAQAEQRLGIVTATIENRLVARTRDYSGEIMLPTDRTMLVTSPLTGTLSAAAEDVSLTTGTYVRKGQTLLRVTPYLAPERDQRPQLERDVQAATEKIAAAKLRYDRAQQLLEGQAGSVKAVEQAREELTLAETDLKSAQQRLEVYNRTPLNAEQHVDILAPLNGVIQKVNAAPGQSTTAGAPLVEITNFSTYWLRVPVYVGDLPHIARQAAARVHGLADAPGAPTRTARPIAAPPSANAAASTADLYYALTSTSDTLRPGQRLGVTLSLRGAEESLTVPWSAVLHDVQGGTWVYEQTAPQVYVRRPVAVRYVADGQAVLARGPAPGTKVVTVGAAELFGTEFGAGK